MSYNITDLDEIYIEVTDGVRTWMVPKFRIFTKVEEPYCSLYWSDSERGFKGVTRLLMLNYNDVTFGYISPSSASEVQQVIDQYIYSAFQPVKYYGSFYDNTPSQTAALVDTPYAIAIGQTTSSNGVTIVNGDEIQVSQTRIYNLQYSIQFTNSDSQFHAVNVWLRNNGFDIPETNSRFSVPGKHGSIDGSIVAAINYVFQITPSDSIQIMWATSDVDVEIETIPATAFCPSSPGIIVTLTDGN